MEAGEINNPQFLEKVKFEMDANAKRAKERTPQTLSENFENAMSTLDSWYVQEKLKTKKIDIFGPGAAGAKKEFQNKTDTFAKYFEDRVFSQFVHASGKDIPTPNTGEVVLLSPEKQALQNGKSSEEATIHQGKIDEMIGSREMVFANSAFLLSRSCAGPSVYEITSTDGFAVGLDIDSMLPPSQQFEPFGDAIAIYYFSKNLMTINDFKTYFATFSAAVFDNPRQALEFFFYNHMMPEFAGVWESDDEVARHAMGDEDKKFAIKIRDLYVNRGLVPPFVPEFQYKDSVKARKVDWQDLRGLKHEF